MTIKELLYKNRSYRGFDEAYSFTKEQLLEFVDHTRYTAASVNMQPFCYYLAFKKNQLAAIQPLTGWARALPNLTLPKPGKHPTGFIVICQNTAVSTNIARFDKDVGIVAEAILLAATEAGYGGIMIANFSAEKLAKAIQLPDHQVPVLVVALGKPAEQIELVEVVDGQTNYYRDENDVHYVPKRKLEDLIIENGLL